MMFKQVIAVRTDLKMSPGKMAAQVAHASHASAMISRKKSKNWYDLWWGEGQKKVVVKIGGENEIIELLKHAKEGNLPFYLVNDAGLPGPEEIIDRITGQLKLL
jgi:PTH2 family peptidyl-tRNA hydrolase